MTIRSAHPHSGERARRHSPDASLDRPSNRSSAASAQAGHFNDGNQGDARTSIVLFSGGASAWELGLEWAGVKTLLSCEIDPTRRAFLALNFPDIPHHDDIQTLTGELVRRRCGRSADWRPWLVAGSPPCQDASLANQTGKGLDGERTGLFRHAVRLVRELRPDWVAFENVAGLSVRDCGTILGWLGADYCGWQHRMGDEDVGAPHRAWRRWIIAKRIAKAEEVATGRGGQSRHSEPDPVASPDQGTLRPEVGRGICEDGGLAARPPASASSPDETGEPIGAIDDRPMARRASARRIHIDAWADRANAIARRHLRVATGLPSRMAVKVQECYGDTFPPILAKIWAESMMDAERAA